MTNYWLCVFIIYIKLDNYIGYFTKTKLNPNHARKVCILYGNDFSEFILNS